MELKGKAKKYVRGKGLKTLSHTPDWVYRIKGAFDARKDASFSESYIAKLTHSTNALINREILMAEELLFPKRKKAAALIADIKTDTDKLSGLPEATEQVSSAMDARANKLISEARTGLSASINSKQAELCVINEYITAILTALEQRIDKIKFTSLRKIKSYEAGLKTRGLHNPSAVSFSEESINKYTSRHEKLDSTIRTLADIKEVLA